MLYRKGMQVAERFRQELCPKVLRQNAWIPADTDEGVAYWEALQLVKAWTEINHAVLHDMAELLYGVTLTQVTRVVSSHNFVFREGSVYAHAKGATPMVAGELQLVPMNMSEGVWVVQPSQSDFAPHGAGRNVSRTAYLESDTGKAPPSVTHRFYSGHPDVTEYPGAYKDPQAIESVVEAHSLATIVDRIRPHGVIMAGRSQFD